MENKRQFKNVKALERIMINISKINYSKKKWSQEIELRIGLWSALCVLSQTPNNDIMMLHGIQEKTTTEKYREECTNMDKNTFIKCNSKCLRAK